MIDVTVQVSHYNPTFYVASSRDAIHETRAVTAALELLGLTNTFSWTEHIDHVCSASTCGIADRVELARVEAQAASDCGLFVGIARLGKGSHVELGLALTGRASMILLVGVDPADSAFYCHPKVRIVAHCATAISLIVSRFAAHLRPGVDREPTPEELDRIARAILDDAQRLPRGQGAACHPGWGRAVARAAWGLGARHDGAGELHGPVQPLGARPCDAAQPATRGQIGGGR